MVLFGVHRGRFSRVWRALALSALLLAACGGDSELSLGESPPGPASLSDAQWGALLFQDRGCTGCHEVAGSDTRSLAGRVSVTSPRADSDSDEASSDEASPEEAAVVVHDQEWATALLLEPDHGVGEAGVQLALGRRQAHALAAYLATCR